MENKILVKIYVPMLDETFDIFVPVNEYIWKMNRLLIGPIGELSNNALPVDKNYIFVNSETGMIYDNNMIIINTDIRNATKLTLLDV